MSASTIRSTSMDDIPGTTREVAIPEGHIALFQSLGLKCHAAVAILKSSPLNQRPSKFMIDYTHPDIYNQILYRTTRYLALRAKSLWENRAYRRDEIASILKQMGLRQGIRMKILRHIYASEFELWPRIGVLGWCLREVLGLYDRLVSRGEIIKASMSSRTVNDQETMEERGCVCGICLNDKAAGESVSVLKCGHWFATECIIAWLTKDDSCPTCRRVVLVEHEDEIARATKEERWEVALDLRGDDLRDLLREQQPLANRREGEQSPKGWQPRDESNTRGSLRKPRYRLTRAGPKFD